MKIEEIVHTLYESKRLKHHQKEVENPHAVVINNQSSTSYPNKELVGAGVVLKFIQYFDEMEHTQYFIDYMDLAMFAQISDMFPNQTPESRLIYEYGLTHINNKFLKAMIEKQSFKLGDELTQLGLAFYITPLINALIRVGNDIQKERLFEAFTNPNKQIPSTKQRNQDSKFETVIEQTIRNCVNAKSYQDKEKAKAAELLDIQILNECLDDNKILILNVDDLDIPKTLTGLCAMGVVARHKKPVLLGRTNAEGYFKGSIRNVSNSELTDLRQFLLDSNLVEYVSGHSNAAGLSLKETNIDKLTSYANEKLADIDFNEGIYNVDFVVKAKTPYLKDLIYSLDDGKKLWGQGNEEPLIVVENIPINKNSISIIGQKKNVIRFEFNGITYLKFFAEDVIEEIQNKKDRLVLTVVGKGKINHFNGTETPQILIDDIEIGGFTDEF